jgi:hypothetical protein
MVLLLGLALGRRAAAYPTAAVFVPTAETKPLAAVELFAYTSVRLAPSVGPGVEWLGVEAGILPPLPYGRSGLRFGGLEIGLDLFLRDLDDTPAAYTKAVVNLKLQLLAETRWAPSLAAGVMEVAPLRPARSMNLVYGVVSKTVRIAGRSFGRLTLGVGWGANDFTGDPFAATEPTFVSTAPFATSSRLALLAGYELPAFGPVSFAVDHFGGLSEVSSTNVGMSVALAKGLSWAVGGWFSNDPNVFSGGLFSYVTLDFDLRRIWTHARP